MNNDDFDDIVDAASAYLDGELEADARRRVESDPRLLAAVERLRLVRAVLGDVEPAPISIREQQLAAALVAWDRVPDGRAMAGDPTPGSLISTPAPSSLDAHRRSRQRWNRMLTAAAAVVVIGGGVAVVASGGLGNDADDSGGDAQTSATNEALDAQDQLAVEAGNEFGSLADETPPADVAADEADRTAQTEIGALEEAEVASTRPAADGSDTEVAEGDAAESQPVIGGEEAPPPDGDLEILENRADLVAFARFAIDAPSSPVPQTTDSTAIDDDNAETAATLPDCGFDVIVGPAIFEGTLVIVGIDADRDQAVAYLADDCAVVERAAL